jgi:cell division septation protein DedD
MRGYFDEEEDEPERPRRDTELTLGPGSLLAIFFGLVLVCGVCFGLGYAVGRHTSGLAAANPAHPSGTDQEPLQSNGFIAKPSAYTRAPLPPPGDATQTSATAEGAYPGAAQQSPAQTGQDGAGPGAQGETAQTQVWPALPAAANTPRAAAAPNVHPVLPAVPLMVQIAAVSNPEDAIVLTSALRKRGYAVTASREPADRLIHVRIGPFNSRDEANRWCLKLLNDGYNAIIQP